MRTPIWMIAGLFVALLMMDITTIWAVREKIDSSVEHSLDSYMIAGAIENDLAWGKIYIDHNKGVNAAGETFRENMKLDGALENEFMKDTNFQITSSEEGKRSAVTAATSTTIQAMIPKLFGMEGIPITITKKQYHSNEYK